MWFTHLQTSHLLHPLSISHQVSALFYCHLSLLSLLSLLSRVSLHLPHHHCIVTFVTLVAHARNLPSLRSLCSSLLGINSPPPSSLPSSLNLHPASRSTNHLREHLPPLRAHRSSLELLL